MLVWVWEPEGYGNLGIVIVLNDVNSDKETEKVDVQKVRRGAQREAASRIHVAKRVSA